MSSAKSMAWYAETALRVGIEFIYRLRRELNSAVLEVAGPPEFRRVWDAVDSIGGFSRERADSLMLYALAKNAPGTGCVVEVGSFLGRSTAILVHGVRASDRASRVVAIDPHRGGTGDVDSEDPQAEASTLPLMLHNLRRLGLLDQVEIEHSDAPTAAKQWTHGPVRLLFVDALHTYDAVRADFEAIQPHLDAGAIVVFDDYRSDEYPGVVKIVDELERAGRLPRPARTVNRYRIFGITSMSEILQ